MSSNFHMRTSSLPRLTEAYVATLFYSFFDTDYVLQRTVTGWSCKACGEAGRNTDRRSAYRHNGSRQHIDNVCDLYDVDPKSMQRYFKCPEEGCKYECVDSFPSSGTHDSCHILRFANSSRKDAQTRHYNTVHAPKSTVTKKGKERATKPEDDPRKAERRARYAFNTAMTLRMDPDDYAEWLVANPDLELFQGAGPFTTSPEVNTGSLPEQPAWNEEVPMEDYEEWIRHLDETDFISDLLDRGVAEDDIDALLVFNDDRQAEQQAGSSSATIDDYSAPEYDAIQAYLLYQAVTAGPSTAEPVQRQPAVAPTEEELERVILSLDNRLFPNGSRAQQVSPLVQEHSLFVMAQAAAPQHLASPVMDPGYFELDPTFHAGVDDLLNVGVDDLLDADFLSQMQPVQPDAHAYAVSDAVFFNHDQPVPDALALWQQQGTSTNVTAPTWSWSDFVSPDWDEEAFFATFEFDTFL